MKTKVIAIFDIGKTNKKLLLFNQDLQVVYQDEQKFPEIKDDEGFECDDIEKIEDWISESLKKAIENPEYEIVALNFTTYGATLMYLDENGNRLTPIYNYLKPMPEGIVEPLYERYGGVAEFSRKTASPALGMLNSGLQALWLKMTKPEIYGKTKSILHFPQYLSNLFSGKITSELTSIGCHTALWDFDEQKYHQWVQDEAMPFPAPVSNYTHYSTHFDKKPLEVGIGIHDSSASLAPYIENSAEPFILLSTGTWCINMNPFNEEPLTMDQLNKDCLCYLGVHQKPVKSSRLFMGHIHEVNLQRLCEYYSKDADYFKTVSADEVLMQSKLDSEKIFFRNGIPKDYVDNSVDLGTFGSFETAYLQLIADLARECADAVKLVIPANDITKCIYVSGGFARNEVFVRMLATLFPKKKVYTSEVDNSTALGAALMLWETMGVKEKPKINLGLKEYQWYYYSF
jgi:sugar (pentulose or hexulose) kinase